MPSPPDRRPRWPLFALVAFVAVTGFLLVRWAAGPGTVEMGLPEGSTFSAKPEGALAIFEATDMLADRRALRNLLPWANFDPGNGETVVILNFTPRGDTVFGETEAKELDRWLDRGARVVVCLRDPTWSWQPDDPRDSASPPTDTRDPENQTPGSALSSDENAIRALKVSSLDDEDIEQVDLADPAGGPSTIPWTGSLALSWPDGHAWSSVAAFDGRPVAAVLAKESGSLVVVGSSRFLFNRALRNAPPGAFFPRLWGPEPTIHFEESHLGSQIQPGVMTLIHRYRLHGMVVGAVLLFGLLVWQGLVPVESQTAGATESGPDEGQVTGLDAASGVVHLMQRSIPPESVLTTCLNRWARDPGRPPRPGDAAALAASRPIAENAQPGQIAARYRQMAELLNPPLQPRRPDPKRPSPRAST